MTTPDITTKLPASRPEETQSAHTGPQCLHPTGLWLSELTHAWHVFEECGSNSSSSARTAAQSRWSHARSLSADRVPRIWLHPFAPRVPRPRASHRPCHATPCHELAPVRVLGQVVQPRACVVSRLKRPVVWSSSSGTRARSTRPAGATTSSAPSHTKNLNKRLSGSRRCRRPGSRSPESERVREAARSRQPIVWVTGIRGTTRYLARRAGCSTAR
jgi:hypothetical protein